MLYIAIFIYILMRQVGKIRFIASQMGTGDVTKLLVELYTKNKMSAREIADYILQNTGVEITERSIQRKLKKHIEMRSVGESFRLAIERGRVRWAYKDKKIKRIKLNPKLRMQILERDNFKCVFCGATPKEQILEVDHKIAISRGGLSIPDNLQTLCYDCNKGKQYSKKETRKKDRP